MKNLNLTMAIIYTVIYTLLIMTGLSEGDMDLVLGTVLLSGPVVVNWITYRNLKE